jgi:hypothetical protein
MPNTRLPTTPLYAWRPRRLPTITKPTRLRTAEAFLILEAQKVGLAVTLVPLVLVIMNVVYALAA